MKYKFLKIKIIYYFNIFLNKNIFKNNIILLSNNMFLFLSTSGVE